MNLLRRFETACGHKLVTDRHPLTGKSHLIHQRLYRHGAVHQADAGVGGVAVEDKKGESWIVVTDMTKDDLFNLAHYAVTEDDFEMDDYDKTSRPNPIHRIIY